MKVDSSTGSIRPYVSCAVLRGVKFNKQTYKSFIDLQEKLHQNICRKRTYVAIGTHDLDTIKGPFLYTAQDPKDINFVPLTETSRSFSGKDLLDHYRNDSECKHLKPYTDIIYDSPVYPVIYDSEGRVLSMPPIINGRHSRIQLSTENVFIECTGTDLTKVNIVLDTVVTMFSEYCAEKFTVEEVEVTYSDGAKKVTPLLSRRECKAKVSDINGTIGVTISPEKICQLCDRMQLGPSRLDSTSSEVIVQVPPTRSDVLHPVDVIEDVAIAYGYNNLDIKVPNTLCFGKPLPINLFTDLIRNEVAKAGYMEMLTHGLCSTAENFSKLRRPVGPAVSLSNPANVEYEVVRTTLLPGALKTLAHNKSLSHKNGIKLFEISDVVEIADNEIGCKNRRSLVGLFSSFAAKLEVIHGLVDRIMTAVQIKPDETYAMNSLTTDEFDDIKRVAKTGVSYNVRQTEDPCYFPGMRAEIYLTFDDNSKPEQVVGTMGVVHPEVLEKFEISHPCSAVEIDIEALM